MSLNEIKQTTSFLVTVRYNEPIIKKCNKKKERKEKKGDIFKGIKVKLICRTYSYVDHNMAITKK